MRTAGNETLYFDGATAYKTVCEAYIDKVREITEYEFFRMEGSHNLIWSRP